ncbi:Kelch-like protein 12-like [Homarus americanus]|uniref:Kelch-like protein 12-like n=1 Tax=Homarus americanus TaxID=6706 RepID=A0A8J5JM73_HOMAM|nr:Kelch-like protein 12-like [Homarus americanus]
MALTLLPNNAMTFTENQHGTAVLEKLRNQRELIRCCDVILHVARRQFQAHRCVLAACSPYFDSIFKASKTVKEQLTISSQDPEVFRCLLAYMYTGTVVVDKTNVAELLRLANKLLIAKLKEHCAEYLERYLDATNCLTVRDMATKFNLEALEKTTGTFIQAHLSDIIEGEEVLDLSHTRLEDFLSSPSWQLHEDQTLLLVTRWVHRCPQNRERNLRSLLTWVQWSCLNPQTAIYLIQTHPLYTNPNSLLALFFLLDSLNEHSLLPADLLAPFSKLKAKFCQSTDSVVDNESFLSLAISTAIDKLQDDQIGSGRSQETLPSVSDFSNHTVPPPQDLTSDTEDDPANQSSLQSHHKISDFHNSRRGCDGQEEEQHNQYDMCHIGHSTQDVHINQPNLIFSHPPSASNAAGCHSHVSEDSVGDTTTTDDNKFACNNQGHFGQSFVRNMAVWHQEPPYGAEESLSSDSSHMYQRQVYDQNFSMKVPCSDSYTSRVNPSGVYPMRENPLKNKQGFASAVSYYVSTYNPEDDMTVSDDQSTQSFPYDENFNPAINFYPCRSGDVKDTQHIMIEPHHNQENYAKSYYHDESTTTQDINCNQRDIYYNENSTDTQISNCPQDMTVQHQFPQCSEVKQEVSQNQEFPEKVVESTDTSLTNAVPERFLADESHYEHYPLKNSAADKFHREMNRLGEESLLALGPREMSTQDLLLDGKRLSSECGIETRGIFTLVGGTVDGDRTYKGCPSECLDGDRVYKGCSSDVRNILTESETSTDNQRNLQDDISKAVPAGLRLFVPPRQVKFKINRSVNSSGSGLVSDARQDIGVSSEASLPSTTAVNSIDMLHLKTEELNPDDPNEVLQEDVIDGLEKQDIKQVAGKKHDTKDLTITQVNKFKEVNEESETPSAVNKEPLRRTSRRVKLIEKVKAEVVKTTPASTERVCELCQASFPLTKEYFVHMREHFPGPPHCCDTCEASFKRIYHLLEHRVIHQETKTHKCPHCKICGDLFFRIQAMHYHETKHTMERPFLCETCGWSGKTKNALVLHTKFHTGELHRCQFPNCNYTTGKKSHLKEHMQHHSNSRPFVCDVCNRTFITNSHLQRHMKLHLPEKLNKCPQCDYCSPRPDRLKTHIEKKHSQKESVKVPARNRQSKKKRLDMSITENPTEVTRVVKTDIECSQADIFSDLENTNVSLQPQLPGTPPPTTLSEYPPSPTYTFPAQSAPDDPLMIVPDMSSVTEGFNPLPQASPLHRNLGPSLNYEESYHSPQYQTSPSHFAALSPTHAALSYANGHHQEGSPLNFAAYMKY